MATMYELHACATMNAAQMAGLQSLMVPPGDGEPVPLSRAELDAMHASPKLRAWLLPRLASFGNYQLHALLEGRTPVGLAEYLGAQRDDIASVVTG